MEMAMKGTGRGGREREGSFVGAVDLYQICLDYFEQPNVISLIPDLNVQRQLNPPTDCRCMRRTHALAQ